MHRTVPLAALVLSIAAACGGPAAPSWVPLSAGPPAAAELTLVWVGRGEAERLVDGHWQRAPAFDYDFTVEQHRRGARWESVKSLRRRHPDYDGSAGPRLQTYFFQIEYAPGVNGVLTSRLRTSLGDGTGTSDAEFRTAALELRPDVSALAPFDRYRISQRYLYEEGRLEEIVELLDGEEPWVRNREVAHLFAQRKLAGAPTW